MASANWAMASQLQARLPHTYTAIEHLVMAMADAHNNQGKTNFFGQDKGLKSYMKFEEKLKGALLAMTKLWCSCPPESVDRRDEIARRPRI